MLEKDLDETRETLTRIKRFSKIAGIILAIIFAALTLYWAFFAIASVISLVFSIAIPFAMTENPLLIIPFACSGFLMAFLFKIGADVFLDVAKGETPFALIQVKRMRMVSIILVLYTIFEAMLSPGFMAVLQLSGFDVGYSMVDYVGSPSVSINVGALLVAALCFSLSLIFKYGVLLQEFSDETL